MTDERTIADETDFSEIVGTNYMNFEPRILGKICPKCRGTGEIPDPSPILNPRLEFHGEVYVYTKCDAGCVDDNWGVFIEAPPRPKPEPEPRPRPRP